MNGRGRGRRSVFILLKKRGDGWIGQSIVCAVLVKKIIRSRGPRTAQETNDAPEADASLHREALQARAAAQIAEARKKDTHAVTGHESREIET